MVSHGEFEKFGFRLSFIVHVGSYFQLIIGKIRFMKIICVEKSRKLCKLTEKQTSTFLGTLPAHALHYCNRTAVCVGTTTCFSKVNMRQLEIHHVRAYVFRYIELSSFSRLVQYEPSNASERAYGSARILRTKFRHRFLAAPAFLRSRTRLIQWMWLRRGLFCLSSTNER